MKQSAMDYLQVSAYFGLADFHVLGQWMLVVLTWKRGRVSAWGGGALLSVYVGYLMVL